MKGTSARKAEPLTPNTVEAMPTTNTFSVYFAGELFDHKDLAGNALLAEHLTRESGGRYVAVMPQDHEAPSERTVDIRNLDLRLLMQSDLAVFAFDGNELDSGTVVEFVFAKALDIPAVIFRTDFRASGDQGGAGDDWNLMCSFWPRTRTVSLHAMAWYRDAISAGGGVAEGLARFYGRLASRLSEELDEVRREPSLASAADPGVDAVYRWALRFPGSGFDVACAEVLDVADLVAAKRARGLL